MAIKNITMRQKTASGYDTLYPATIAAQIADVYSKTEIEDLLSDKVKIETGSYIGTGTYGAENPNTIQLDFVPKMVVVKRNGNVSNIVDGSFPWINGSSSGISRVYYSSDLVVYGVNIDWGKTVSWYNGNSADRQLNQSGSTYYWIAIG